MGYLEGLMGQKEKIVFKTRQHWLVIVPKLVFVDGRNVRVERHVETGSALRAA